ncbi:MAG TPA: DUF6781 family protein [Planctomycetota bacterium]|nr:DUF6781 family protein [Planctomycetota bacterium]
MDARVVLQRRVEELVRRGGQVRREVAAAFAKASEHAHAVADGLIGLARAALAGAMKGIETAVPADRESTLRSVLDGLGDGLATAAQAAELTLREAHSRSARFAEEDLQRLAGDFESVSRRFADTVKDGVAAVGGLAAKQATAVKDHAAVTLRRIQPAVAAAIAIARRDPLGLGGQALGAGAAAVRGAVGALFTEIGRQLQAIGVTLEHRDPPPP